MAWRSDPPSVDCYLSEKQLKVMMEQLRYWWLGGPRGEGWYKAPTMLPAGSIVGALYHKL